MEEILDDGLVNKKKGLKTRNCPPPSLLAGIPKCPQKIEHQFSSVKFYNKHKVAIDSNGNYLGQWEYIKEPMCIKITKDPDVNIKNFNAVTGDCEFTKECNPFIKEAIISFCYINDNKIIEELELEH